MSKQTVSTYKQEPLVKEQIIALLCVQLLDEGKGIMKVAEDDDEV